jgi:cytochrome P450
MACPVGSGRTTARGEAAPADYEPPRPRPLGALTALLRAGWRGDGDLLSLLPKEAYQVDVGPLGYSRRSILIVNAPELTRTIMTDPTDIYPKNDLMVGALKPLVGESIFVSNGEPWRRQRRMIDPAFSHIRLARAFGSMTGALDDCEERLARAAQAGEAFSIDLAMSQLTADIICRTVFSTSLDTQIARDVFTSFAHFERSVAHVEIRRLIFDRPFKDIPQKPDVLESCRLIRAHMRTLLDTHLAAGARYDDICSAVMAARDADSGAGFTEEQLIDQLGVFFLAGHETTASALTWAVFIAAQRPEVAQRIREEVEAEAGLGAIGFEAVRRLAYTRNVFREALRLYPPITFIPRVAADATRIGRYRVKRGAMIMIAPWTIHRHEKLWRDPHRFDPDRFSPEREHELVPGAYMPFGFGPRICVGAAFATLEATLILARLFRRFDFTVRDAGRVEPVARLTTRPKHEIMALARPRAM